MRENRILSHVSYLRSLLAIVCSWPPSWSTRNPYRASSGKGGLDIVVTLSHLGKAQLCKIMRIRQAIDDGELVAHLAPTTL